MGVALGVSAYVVSTEPVHACGRPVYINGTLPDCQHLAFLDQAVGERIPDGAYWLNYQSGAWGYWGIPVTQGYVDLRAPDAGPGGSGDSMRHSESGSLGIVDGRITGGGSDWDLGSIP